jgi:predicted glycosyltransferase
VSAEQSYGVLQELYETKGGINMVVETTLVIVSAGLVVYSIQNIKEQVELTRSIKKLDRLKVMLTEAQSFEHLAHMINDDIQKHPKQFSKGAKINIQAKGGVQVG